MTTFSAEYEIQIKNLKSEFLACKEREFYCISNHASKLTADTRLNLLKTNYRTSLSELQKFVLSRFNVFDARNVSSLVGILSQPISDNEKLIHRIWMGGYLPPMASETIRQWGEALVEIESTMNISYTNILWVWDQDQLRGDPQFKSTIGADRYGVGCYSIGKNVLAVNCLHDLMIDFAAVNAEFIKELHKKKCFVNLSDFFRIVILRVFGGIYLDVDIIPHRSATIFLAKPEVPDYVDFKLDEGSGKIRQCDVSWMNLFNDENGVLVSKKGNRSLKKMVEQMNENLEKIASNFFEKSRHQIVSKEYASMLHDATYGVWQQNIGQTLLSYDDISKHHSVLHDRKKETVIGGLHGMRLVVDAITNVEIPLTAEEDRSYKRCIKALEQIDWRLDNALGLENIAAVSYLDEIPRMAYPSQLRSDVSNCHYYSFLSHDEKLDRVNALFGAYLTAKNSERIKEKNFWQKVKGSSPQVNRHLSMPASSNADLFAQSEVPPAVEAFRSNDSVHFIPAKNMRGEEYKNRMAKLLFSTSYLEYCSFSNKLNLPFVELQRHQNIDQYISHIYGMFDCERKFAGFFTAGTIEELGQVKAISYYRDEMKAMDDAYDEFISKNTDASDLFVPSLAVEQGYRGKGLFNTMFNEIKSLANRKGSRRIVIAVWGKSDAFRIYLKKGFKVRNTFDYAYDVFFDRLHILEYGV